MKIKDLSTDQIETLAALALENLYVLSVILGDEITSIDFTKEELIKYLENVRTRRIKEEV